MSKPADSGLRRIPTLDGLRAISIVLVLLGHLSGTRGFPHALDIFFEFANFGVRVFFVISGFLITSLLLKELEKTGTISLWNFYVRRTLRIFPAAYAFMLALAVASALGGVVLNQNDLLHAFTYTSNFHLGRSWYTGHLWSLSVEEQFYLLWPAALFLLGTRAGLVLAAAVVFVSPGIRAAAWYGLPQWRGLIGVASPTIADPLATGCILALARSWLRGNRWYVASQESKVFLLVPLFGFGLNLFSNHVRTMLLLGDTLMNVSIALTLDWCMSHPQGRIGRLLDSRPVAFVGVLSYSLYLWQQVFLNRHSTSLLASFPTNILLASVCAYASYRLVEQPFLGLRSAFAPAEGRERVSASVLR